ncbi:MAG TPA: HepT-like ribonuclease domain-containing protein [Anaerolineales bacterium]|nr:HepT-like ribonuclease domain-containing protein [Anaerolineales bacterium]
MSRDETLYLEDIQESCEKVLQFTKGMTYKDFVREDLHFDAVLRNLEIIGEAVKNISEQTRQNYPDVKWRMNILESMKKQFGISSKMRFPTYLN